LWRGGGPARPNSDLDIAAESGGDSHPYSHLDGNCFGNAHLNGNCFANVHLDRHSDQDANRNFHLSSNRHLDPVANKHGDLHEHAGL
jgi:hypothetical protein